MYERAKKILTYLARSGTITVPSPGAKVTGPVPDRTKVVSKPRYTLVGDIYQRAKPLLTYTNTKRERNALQPMRELGCRPFPKRKFMSIPSIRAASWQCSLFFKAKNGNISVNSHPFLSVFSGIKRV